MSLQLDPLAPIFVADADIGPRCQNCGVSTISGLTSLQLLYDRDNEESSDQIEVTECWCNTLNRCKYRVWYTQWMKEVDAANTILRFIYRHRYIR